MTQLSLFQPKPVEKEPPAEDLGILRRYLRAHLRIARGADHLPWHADDVPRIEESFLRYSRHLPAEEAREFVDGLQAELARLREADGR